MTSIGKNSSVQSRSLPDRNAAQGLKQKVRRRRVKYLFYLIIFVVTTAVCEVTFRVYDALTTPHHNTDTWVKETSRKVQEHPLLGYTYPPNKVINDSRQADEFGMSNVPEALQWKKVDVVGIGDSYAQVANGVFFERFKANELRYHSLAIFGYGPGQYNVLMREYGPKLHPKVYLYFVYLGNDPGDIRRYENWQASGKTWYEFNDGYFMPIQRRGVFWGWRLFLGRAKGFTRTVLSRKAYGALKGIVKRDEAETVFEYVLRANVLAQGQKTPMLVLIIPRMARHKPLLDPIANKLADLCAKNNIACLDLDPAFGDVEGRARFFAPDGHWNEAGIQASWAYLWDRKRTTFIPAQKSAQ
jgi:hypothetical protein